MLMHADTSFARTALSWWRTAYIVVAGTGACVSGPGFSAVAARSPPATKLHAQRCDGQRCIPMDVCTQGSQAMAAPNQRPLHAVQVAANIIARELARGVALPDIVAAYPDAVGGLSAAEQAEAAGYAAGAAALSEAIRESPTGTTFADLERQGYQGTAGGVLRVTLRYDTPQPGGEPIEHYRTVLIGPAGYTTFSIAQASAVAELVERDNAGYGPGYTVSPDYAEVLFEPFDLYGN